MAAEGPIHEVGGSFADDMVAREVADALGRWLRWILGGSDGEPPAAFEPFGVATADFRWAMGEDVDWELGPHARAQGDDVRISLETHDTHFALMGLLKRLGARRVWAVA